MLYIYTVCNTMSIAQIKLPKKLIEIKNADKGWTKAGVNLDLKILQISRILVGSV